MHIFPIRRRRWAAAAVTGFFALAAITVAGPALAATGPDLVVTKEASVTEIPVDGEITYTIIARNVGTALATSVRIRDNRIDRELIITSGPTVVGQDPDSPMVCSINAFNNLLCRKKDLAPGASATVTFTAQAPEEACTLVRNRAQTGARNEPLANQGNNVSNFVSVKMTGCPPDTTAPTGSVLINGGATVVWGRQVRLSLDVRDDRTGDPSIMTRISNSPGVSGGQLVNAVTEPYAPTRGWSLTDPARGGTPTTGQKTVYVQYRDRAGNWSSPSSDTILMRRDAPGTCGRALARPARRLNVSVHEQIFPRGDVDWFKLRLRSRTEVTVRLGQLPANYALALANSSCDIRAASNNPGRQAEVIRRTLPAGRYVVRVRGSLERANSLQPYLLRFSTSR